MRIYFFLPSAIEIVCALRLQVSSTVSPLRAIILQRLGPGLSSSAASPQSFSRMIPAGGAARLSAAQLQASSGARPLPLYVLPPHSPASSVAENSGDLKTVLAMCMKARADSAPT